MSIALMGCVDAFTVHSIVEKPDEPGARHDMYGLWVRHTSEGSYLVLRIAPVSTPDRACEVAEVRLWAEPAALDDGPPLEGRACLTELAGKTVVEISTLTDPVLYHQYLVSLEPTQISVCGEQPIWGLLAPLAGEGFSEGERLQIALDGLEYTLREWGNFERLFLISDGANLRAHLDKSLPRVVEHCDSEDGGWMVFNRVNPMPEPDPGAAPDEPADESPSPSEQP
jgi:hypothetical protein